MREITREEIEDGVERLKPWFHCIDMGHGIKTKTASAAFEPADHPFGTWQIIRRCLPEDLAGKTVLDVGCNAGFYSVEAKRRGAARVLGVDAQRHQIRQARFVRRALGLPIDFEKMSVYDLSPHTTGQFDVTLALGLIYHCKHLVLALEKLFQVTRELLILETAILPPDQTPPSFPHVVGGPGSVLHPLAYVENETDGKEAIYNWFLPSTEALRALLLGVGFDEATLFAVEGERAVMLCRKNEPYPDSTVLSQLAARINIEEEELRVRRGEEARLSVRVENTGFARWLAAGETGTERGAVRLAVHLSDEPEDEEDGGELSLYYAGALLPRDLAPGESVVLELVLRAPERPGRYLLEFDMVSEHLSWFEDLGSPTLTRRLRVD